MVQTTGWLEWSSSPEPRGIAGGMRRGLSQGTEPTRSPSPSQQPAPKAWAARRLGPPRQGFWLFPGWAAGAGGGAVLTSHKSPPTDRQIVPPCQALHLDPQRPQAGTEMGPGWSELLSIPPLPPALPTPALPTHTPHSAVISWGRSGRGARQKLALGSCPTSSATSSHLPRAGGLLSRHFLGPARKGTASQLRVNRQEQEQGRGADDHS